jgi:trehalose synthase
MSSASAIARPVRLRRKTVEAYRAIVGGDAVARLRDLARPLRGLRVLELSSTATGGGVAELLSSLVPLEVDLGLEAEWRVIAADRAFFGVTKKIHNGLQGMSVDLDAREQEEYLRHNEANARGLAADRFDVVIVHDPQPAAVRSFLPNAPGRWLWRCHIDSSAPNAATWQFLHPYVERHDQAVFTLHAFVPRDLEIPTSCILPAIDPLTSKNHALPGYLARATVQELGVDLSRPLLLQVSRFDPWKNPLGVIDAWRRAREVVSELQLALVGSMAADDPEGWAVYSEVEEALRGEDAGFLFTDQMGVAGHEVNAFQRTADVAVQLSIREGFGLVVAETLWKGTPMVAGATGGIPTQLEDGVSGYLASTPAAVADRVVGILQDPATARRLGATGHDRVRERFLLPRLLADQLEVLGALAGA